MEVISREEAKQQSLKRFFTGKPCKRNHISERWVSTGICRMCNNETHNRRTLDPTQRVKKLSYDHKYRKNNVVYIRTSGKEYYRRTKDTNPAKFLWSVAKNRAKNKGVDFTITLQDVLSLIPQDSKCPVLGIEMRVEKGKVSANSMTLDRIIPSLGYVPGNICVMTHLANSLKRNQTDPEVFRKIANWLDKHKCRDSIQYASSSPDISVDALVG